MDYKYLLLRYQTFRDEYLLAGRNWLKDRGSWLWQFSLDNCRYLYLGEIHQINQLRHTIKQKNDYIDFLLSHRHTLAHPAIRSTLPEGLYWPKVGFVIRVILSPAAFCIYWIRRFVRLLVNKQFRFLLNTRAPTEDQSFKSEVQGQTGVYIFPDQRQAFPRGLVIFRYRLSVNQPQQATPLLLVNPGHGFLSEYTIPVPLLEGKEIQELLLELPPDIALMKMNVGQGIGFTLGNVSMTEINVIQAARYLKKHYAFSNEDVLNALFFRKLPGVRRIQGHRIPYAQWYNKYIRLTDSDRRAIRLHIEQLPGRPKFSLLLAIDNTRPDILDLTLQSIKLQLYPDWEVIICCRQTPDAHVTLVLNRFERDDLRFRIMIDPGTASISQSSSSVLQSAGGQFTLVMHPGDLLAEHACYLIAVSASFQPDKKLFYSDHDHVDLHGTLHHPCLKQDWDYDFFLGKNFIGHAAFIDTALLKGLELTNEILDHDHQRLLACIEQIPSQAIGHVPYILLHQRTDTCDAPLPVIDDANMSTAIQEHLQRTRQLADTLPVTGGFHIRRQIPAPEPLVSLIILTRDRVALLSNCIDGILNRTRYKNLDVIIIDNGSVDPSTLTYLDAVVRDPRVRVFRRPEDFNFSALNNFAVTQARGEYIGLINNDISVIEDHWLDEMLGHLVRPDVGIVGAKLLYDDHTIQHAGVIIGLGGVAGHGLRNRLRHEAGYDDRLLLTQQLSCVTAACLLTKKSIYEQVDGLDEINLRIAFNDVDYCLKVREQGWKIIWTPFAELYHLESASRASDLSADNIQRWKSEYNFMRNKWRPVLEYDPFYNPNLGIADEEFALALPPRVIHPWERYRYAKQA